MSSTLLLIHGFSGGPSSWDEVAARLLAKNPALHVVRETLLGHGLGPDDDTAYAIGFPGEVDRIAASLRGRGLSNLHVAGYSLGGRIALGLVVGHPDLFARATLIAVHPGLAGLAGLPGLGDREARFERILTDEAWARLLDEEGIAAFAAAWEAQPLFASQKRLSASVRSAERTRRLLHRPEGLALAMRTLSLARMPDYRAALARLALPVRLVVGDGDEKFCALAEEMAGALVHCSIRLVRDAGHNVVLERPDAVASALLEEP